MFFVHRQHTLVASSTWGRSGSPYNLYSISSWRLTRRTNETETLRDYLWMVVRLCSVHIKIIPCVFRYFFLCTFFFRGGRECKRGSSGAWVCTRVRCEIGIARVRRARPANSPWASESSVASGHEQRGRTLEGRVLSVSTASAGFFLSSCDSARAHDIWALDHSTRGIVTIVKDLMNHVCRAMFWYGTSKANRKKIDTTLSQMGLPISKRSLDFHGVLLCSED